MEYRKLPHGEEQISILGLGASSIGASGDKEIRATAELAMEKGINFFDMASADAAPFAAYGAGHGRAAGQSLFPDPFRRQLPGRQIRLDHGPGHHQTVCQTGSWKP